MENIKANIKAKAANVLRNAAASVKGAAKEIATTAKDVAMKHTPIGAAAGAVNLFKDNAALKKSEAGLSSARTKAAEALGSANRKRQSDKIIDTAANKIRTMYNASESIKDILNKVQIEQIKKSNLPEASKNALFEQDMRRSGRLGLPR